MEEEGQNSSHDSENHSVSGEQDGGSEDGIAAETDSGQPDQKTKDWVELNMQSGLAGFGLDDPEEDAFGEDSLWKNDSVTVEHLAVAMFGPLPDDYDCIAWLEENMPPVSAVPSVCRAITNDHRFVYKCLTCRIDHSALQCHNCYDPSLHEGHQ